MNAPDPERTVGRRVDLLMTDGRLWGRGQAVGHFDFPSYVVDLEDGRGRTGWAAHLTRLAADDAPPTVEGDHATVGGVVLREQTAGQLGLCRPDPADDAYRSGPARPADDIAAPDLVVGKAGVPIDAYDAIQILAARPDHPSRLLAEKARAVADWVNDPPFGIYQREQLEEVAPDLVEKLFDLLGGGPGDVSDVRPAGQPVRDSQPEATDG